MKKIITGALALILFTTAAQAQEGRKEGKKGHNKEAKAQLDLTEEQKSKMKELNEAQRNEMKAVEQSKISKEQQVARRREIHKKYAEQRQALLTEEQRAKAAESREKAKKTGKFEGRKGGADAAKDLNLTQSQRDQMQALKTKFSAEREKIRNNSSLSQEQKKEQYRALAQEHQKQVQAILTPEQAQKIKGAKKGRKTKASSTR